MSTIECTIEEFNVAFTDFQKVAGSTNSTQDQVALAHKCLVLHYLGVQTTNEEQTDRCAMLIEVATNGAIRRGWDLMVPDLVQEGKNS